MKLKDNSVISTFEGQSYSLSRVDSHGFVVETDASNNVWSYHSSDGEDTFFALPDVVDISLAKDGDMLIRCQKLSSCNDTNDTDDEAAGSDTISCYKYSPGTGVASSFSFNPKARYADAQSTDSPSDADTQTYYSANSVYLADAGCMMILLYTAQCNPEILVWSLDKGHNDTRTSITSYSDSYSLLQALRDAGTYVSPYDTSNIDKGTDENEEALKEAGIDSDSDRYGDEITLIPDVSAYDWGDLSEINAHATRLEQKYGISIYLGPEVPKKIDYYKIKQTLKVKTLSDALNALEQVLACFPDDFFKQLDYGFLHSLRCIRAREELSDFLHREFQVPIFRFLLLHHNTENRIVIQLALLGKSPHTLRLGKRRCCLFAVDGLNQYLLLIRFKIGNLNRRGHTDFAFIDQVLQFRL